MTAGYQDLTGPGPGKAPCSHERTYTAISNRRICVDCGEDRGPDPLASLPAPRASSAHPDSSHEAAHVASLAMLARRRTVLRWFARWEQLEEGGTLFEAATATGITVQSICGVIKDLRDAGFISRDDGDKRPSPSGNPSRLHRITDLGLEAVESSP